MVSAKCAYPSCYRQLRVATYLLHRRSNEILSKFLRFCTATDLGVIAIDMLAKNREVPMSSGKKQCATCFFKGLLAAIATPMTAWLAVVSASVVWHWIGHVAGVLAVNMISTVTGH